MLDILYGALGALALVLTFGHFVLKALFVPREKFDAQVKELEDKIQKRAEITLEEHKKLATKEELEKLEGSFAALVNKLDKSNKELDAKVSSVQRGLFWLVARAGGKDDVIQKLFEIE